jgi:3-hydroxyisobutyrate dehydrogenase-like beta-hydroxyacid dehydrogenase
MTRRVGFIGLGRMGRPMCRRLLDAGIALTVHTRSPEHAREALEHGAVWAASAAEVARRSDVVCSMLTDGAALREVALSEHGILAGRRPGLLYIDMSTVSPAESATVATACEAAGVDYMRAPVTGSTVLAAAGTLGILLSGPRSRHDEAVAVLRMLGDRFFYLGPAEEARVMKLMLNLLVGVTMASLAESLVLGEKAGLDRRQMLDVFSNSAVASPLVKYKAGPLAADDFSPAFPVRLMGKDFDLALEAARGFGVPVPVAALVRQLWQATASAGWGDQDFTAVLLFLREIAGLARPARGPHEPDPSPRP